MHVQVLCEYCPMQFVMEKKPTLRNILKLNLLLNVPIYQQFGVK